MANSNLASFAPVIDATGIHAPTYADILATLQAKFRSIFGSDAYLEADSQDGQLLAVLARGYADLGAAAVAAYNARSPSTAQGEGLSSVVKINNIRRQSASNSTADVTLTGDANLLVTNGVVSDEAQTNKWSLPANVVIGGSGSVTVTATCQTKGAISAAPGTLTKIVTPTRGWLSVTNASAAAVGAPIEQDGPLRLRRAKSTALPAQTPLQAVESAVAAISGVTRIKSYENDTKVIDANGISPNSIAIVVEGGDAIEIAQQIKLKKGGGTGTVGTSTQIITDAKGIPYLISYSRPALVAIKAEIQIKAATGYTTIVGSQIAQAVADYVNALEIGQDVILTKLYLPANLYGGANSPLFEILSGGITIAKLADSLTTADITIAFNERPTVDVTDISLVVTT